MTGHLIPPSEVRRLFDEGKTIDEQMVILGCSRAFITKVRRELGISGWSKPHRAPNGTRGLSRIINPKRQARLQRRGPIVLAEDHPAYVEARPLFAAVSAASRPNILVSGINHWKIGAKVTKGRWKGFPIYTLTLPERTTCPQSCPLWGGCYGNAMHLAKRILPGEDLERRLEADVATLAERHPGGFAVRLHVLGDFYSVSYVRLWARLLVQHRPLHVFGFSARIDDDDPIAHALREVVARRWDRFAIRFSGAKKLERSAITVVHAEDVPPDAIPCPQQSGKTQCCGACALCWQSERRIAFLQH